MGWVIRIIENLNPFTHIGTTVAKIYVKLTFIRDIIYGICKENIVREHGVGFVHVKAYWFLYNMNIGIADGCYCA